MPRNSCLTVSSLACSAATWRTSVCDLSPSIPSPPLPLFPALFSIAVGRGRNRTWRSVGRSVRRRTKVQMLPPSLFSFLLSTRWSQSPPLSPFPPPHPSPSPFFQPEMNVTVIPRLMVTSPPSHFPFFFSSADHFFFLLCCCWNCTTAVRTTSMEGFVCVLGGKLLAFPLSPPSRGGKGVPFSHSFEKWFSGDMIKWGRG